MSVAVTIPRAGSLWARCIPEPNTGCWLWMGYVGNDGYGLIATRHRPLRAHRAAWIVTHGPIPEGMLVCHRCDQPLCINPAHLFLGTPKDNTTDMIKKGRANRHRLLTDAQAIEIRSRYAAGERHKDIAKVFGVAQGTVQWITSGRHFPHLGGPVVRPKFIVKECAR